MKKINAAKSSKAKMSEQQSKLSKLASLLAQSPLDYHQTCLADKTNLSVKRMSLNRSQCGSCSTKYDTLAGT